MKKLIDIFCFLALTIAVIGGSYMLYDIFATAYKIIILGDSSYSSSSIALTYISYVSIAAVYMGMIGAFLEIFVGPHENYSKEKMEYNSDNIIMWPVVFFYFIFHYVFMIFLKRLYKDKV